MLKRSATIGFFDGVHRGHQYLLEQVKQDAEAHGLAAAVVTFRQHPRQVLQQDYVPQLLTTAEEKERLLLALDLEVIMLDFTIELSRLTAREFMRFLRDNYNVERLVVGYDHRFGHNRAETLDDYKQYATELGMTIVVNTALADNNVNISSTLIRRLIAEGQTAQAEQLLGRKIN